MDSFPRFNVRVESTAKTAPHGDPLRAVSQQQHGGTKGPPSKRHTRIVKISISVHESKSNKNVAHVIQTLIALDPHLPSDAGLSFGYGVGRGWGIEKCVHINTCTHRDPTRFVKLLLRHFEQECAYVEIEGRAWEITRFGTWNPITGEYK